MTPKQRNPNDLTGRNNNARKAQIARLEKRIFNLEYIEREQNERIGILESRFDALIEENAKTLKAIIVEVRKVKR